MLRLSIIAVSLFLGPNSANLTENTPWLLVEITMDEDGFMCPFLTPLFVGILEDKGADWVIAKPQESAVAFCMPLESAQDQEGFTDWLTELGYQAEHVHYLTFDTLSTLPPIPAP